MSPMRNTPTAAMIAAPCTPSAPTIIAVLDKIFSRASAGEANAIQNPTNRVAGIMATVTAIPQYIAR